MTVFKSLVIKRITVLMLICVVVFAVSCKREASDNLTTIDFVLDWTPNTNHTGLYVAQYLGYFEQEGIKVNIHQPPEDSSTALVGSGKVQFGISFQDTLAMAFTRDIPVPVVAVAAVLQHNSLGIASKKSCGIKRPKEFENKTCAIWSSQIEKTMLKYIIENDGGNFNSINMIYGSTDDVVTAFSGNIDAINTFYGWDLIAANLKGINTNFMFFKDVTPVLDYYAPLIIANENYVKENSETTTKFLSALSKGYEYAAKNSEESAEILLQSTKGINKDLALQSQRWVSTQYMAEENGWGKIDVERWNNFYNWLYENKLINKNLSNKGFTNEYLPCYK